MRKKAIVLATACVMILVVVFFEFYVFRTEQTTITVQAWNDASISFGSGSGTWMFLYEPSFGATYESNFNFPFPFFSENPHELDIHGGKPTLTIAWTNDTLNALPLSEIGTLLNATKGASLSLVGLEMTVANANSSETTLVLERLS
jgi:hypothetical protein